PGTGLGWEGQGWIGTDLNRVWLRSEGERTDGQTESADLEVLYGRSISTWWDVVAGVRHDFKPGASQNFAAIGVQGLAPMKFEVSATAYLGEGGQTAANVEAEYELLLTNRLILQPLVEVTAYGKNDPLRGIGSGLSTAEAGLRLRYEFTRKFAPYIGVVYERAFGNTADMRREHGESFEDTRLVVGLRTWF
ncbi:copper resistance protein B, partial [Xanthomonas perforans]